MPASTPLLILASLLVVASCRTERDGTAHLDAQDADGGRAAHSPCRRPRRASLPPLLSQTGAFTAVGSLTPVDALVAFSVNAPLWSDGADKLRWMALPPGGRIGFAATGAWRFPAGTVFVKNFALPIDERDPARLRRLETRLLVRDAAGGVYGVTYRWRDDQSDAELLPDGRDEDIAIRTAAGGERLQRWHYPSRSECLQCHNPAAGLVLGVNARQLNGPHGEGAPARRQPARRVEPRRGASTATSTTAPSPRCRGCRRSATRAPAWSSARVPTSTPTARSATARARWDSPTTTPATTRRSPSRTSSAAR